MKQFDVGVTPPVTTISFMLTLTCMTFDFDPLDLDHIIFKTFNKNLTHVFWPGDLARQLTLTLSDLVTLTLTCEHFFSILPCSSATPCFGMKRTYIFNTCLSMTCLTRLP